MESRILDWTVETSPFLCPEIRLRLVTPACTLWRATQADLDAMGLPDPFWAFAWAGGQALARYILDHPEEVRGLRVLDFGAGCGIEAVAAAMRGAARVRAVDIDPWAVAALRINARINRVRIQADAEDMLGQPLEGWDLVLAGDMTYEGPLTQRILAWFHQLARGGTRVLVADPGRGFLVSGDLEPLARYEAPADVDPDGTSLRTTTVYGMGRG